MSIEIKEVITKADMKKFVDLQFELYKGNKFWAPPLKKGEIKYLDPNLNPAFGYADAKFYLAYKDGKVVGRIGAIVNHKYNEKVGKKFVRFTKPEFTDDAEVVDALIKKVEDFGKEKGMEEIHGPLGFSNLDTQGLLTEGFEELQSVASVYHLPYYKDHFDRLGFEKENDWVEFTMTLTEDVLSKASRGSAMIQKRYGFEVMHFNNTKEMKQYAPLVFEIINEAFEVLPYTTPFDTKLKQYYIDKYFDILNPKYVKALKKDEELIGFQIAVPSMSKAMQKANGKLTIGGILALMKARKHNDTADLFLTGVVKKHQNSGAAVVLFSEIQNALHRDGIDTLETTGIFESNNEVIANWKNYQHVLNKRRRCYVKKM
ncbi:MAG: hypothetical protein JXL97_05420 [Bacteroidales bacterium]|nr:hypothetical protein [Bacteroidales bacterium]